MPDGPPSRRQFLKQSGLMAAGAAGLSLLAPQRLDARRTAHELLADHPALRLDDVDLLAFARKALDAARAAGAQYADVRINRHRMFQINVNSYSNGTTFIYPGVSAGVSMGVRAVVNGSWGFAGDSRVAPEIAERVGRLATAFARDGHRRISRDFQFAEAPVIPDGRWESPMEKDPFALPIGHYLDLYVAGRDAVIAIKGIGGVSGTPNWLRTDRLFASTEGSVIRQTVHEANPNVQTWAARTGDNRRFVSGQTSADAGQYGYESFARLDLKADWVRAAQDCVRKAALPFKLPELGQYDLVLGPGAVASLMLPTGLALKLDRALGLLADESGTTFTMPPSEILGKFELGTSALNITGDRSRPHAIGTIGWDEEGVKPETFPLVQQGTIVDYVTTRSLAPELGDWYRQRSVPIRSHGCASRTGRLQPILQLPNLTLEPARDGGSEDDLIKQVKRGYYVKSCGMLPDQQLLNIQCPGGEVYEISNGKLGPAVEDLAIQLTLPRFWKSVATLGNPASARLEHIGVDGPDEDRMSSVGVKLVPLLVRQQNVINIGREA